MSDEECGNPISTGFFTHIPLIRINAFKSMDVSKFMEVVCRDRDERTAIEFELTVTDKETYKREKYYLKIDSEEKFEKLSQFVVENSDQHYTHVFKE